MRSSRRAPVLSALLLVLCSPCLAGGQASDDPPRIDPFTGQPVAPTEPPAPAEPEVPAGPDLSPLNELILEGSYEDAEALLEGLVAEYPESPDVLLMYGEVLVAQRKLEPAIATLEKCASIAPDRPRLHFQLGAALAQQGENERALDEFGKEIAINDDPKVLTLAHINRTAIFAEARNWQAAAAELEAVVALDPEQVQAYGDIVSFHLQAREPDLAADALTRGAAAGFVSASHYYSLGALFYRDERYDDALAAFSKAIEIDPTFARAERSLGATYDKLDRPTDAVTHFRRYIELAPEAPDAASIAEKIRHVEGS